MIGTTAFQIVSGEYADYTAGYVFADRGDAERFAVRGNRAKPTQDMRSRLDAIRYAPAPGDVTSVDDLPDAFWLPGPADMSALRVEEVQFFRTGELPEIPDSNTSAR